METIFDYNPTKKEIAQIGLRFSNKEQYIADHDQDDAFLALTKLFYIRGDEERGKMYFDKMSDDYPPKMYALMTDLRDDI